MNDLIRKIMLLSHERGIEVNTDEVLGVVDELMDSDLHVTQTDGLEYLVLYLETPRDLLWQLHDEIIEDDSDDHLEPGYPPF